MKIIFITIFVSVYLYANNTLTNIQKETIDKAIEKLKNDKHIIQEFYFIGKMQCYLNANIGNPRYIKTSLDMQMNTYMRMPYRFVKRKDIEKYFKKIYTKDALYDKRTELAKNQELYKNKRREEHWTGYYVCEKINEITPANLLKYQNFIENSKKNLKYSSYLYDDAIVYLNNKNYYSMVLNQDNNETNTKLVISKLTKKPYTAEASAIRASIMLNNLNITVPKQYWDDIGRVGKMKNKPIIATAKKFKEFMDDNFDGKRIDIEMNTMLTIDSLKKEFGDNKGIYIFIPTNPKEFKLTGHVTIWDGNTSKSNRRYYQNTRGKATLYIKK